MGRQILDISRAIGPDSLVYPGDPSPRMEPIAQIGPDSPFSITSLHWNTHLLTHLDPPSHFLPGAPGIDELPLERFFGEALVIEVASDVVSVADIPAAGETRGRSLLFRTRNSAAFDPRHYAEDYVYLAPEAARAAVERGVNLVGIDYLSVDRFGDESFPVHRILLGAGVPILEGLDLAGVAPGHYTLAAFPLKITGGDGSPVRAVLIKD